jgi:ABC-type lipoprotein export system ATPase subunit
MNGEAALIQCSNLVKIYQVADLEVVALQGLDLQVQRGEMLGIIGPSGSGKSTLLNILGGLDRPSAGAVAVAGQDLAKLSDAGLDRYRREVVGFVWQQPARNLTPYLTVSQNVGLPQTLAGRSLRRQRQRTAELLAAVGLTGRRRHRLVELSGGEQQRVAIAVALANEPTLLLGDEPTGELDSANAQAIYDLLRGLNRDLGLTTIIVSHDPGIAARVDRVVAIRDGRTSTETVRRTAERAPELAALPETGTPAEHRFDEYVVVDAVGRLQVPRAYLERLGIAERAELELREDGILIRPPGKALRGDHATRD